MSTAAKLVSAHPGFNARPGLITGWLALRPDRRRVIAVFLFAIVVALGSVWAVYTMRYYDDLGLKEGPGLAEKSAIVVPVVR